MAFRRCYNFLRRAISGSNRDAYTFRQLTRNNKEEVEKLIEDVYTEFEPVSSCLGHNSDDVGVLKSECLKDALHNTIGIGAYSRDGNQLVAAILGQVKGSNPKQLSRSDKILPLNVRQNNKLVDSLLSSERISKFTDERGEYVLLGGLSCRLDHRNKGLASQLLNRIESTTRRKGYKAILYVTASCYVHRMAAKHEYGEITSIRCDEYVDPFTGKRIFANMRKPHNTISVFAKHL